MVLSLCLFMTKVNVYIMINKSIGRTLYAYMVWYPVELATTPNPEEPIAIPRSMEEKNMALAVPFCLAPLCLQPVLGGKAE